MLGLEPSSCSSTEQPGSAARMHTCAASSSLRILGTIPSWWRGGRERRGDAAQLPEAQIRLGCPAPLFGPPVRKGARRAEVGGAAGAGQLTGIGLRPLRID
jgi:hypothetical protein